MTKHRKTWKNIENQRKPYFGGGLTGFLRAGGSWGRDVSSDFEKKCVLVFLFVPVLVARFWFFCVVFVCGLKSLGLWLGRCHFLKFRGSIFSRLTCQERQGNPAGPHGTWNAKIFLFFTSTTTIAQAPRPRWEIPNWAWGLLLCLVLKVLCDCE